MRRTLHRASSKLRALTPMVDRLEARQVLSTIPIASTGQVFAPMFEAIPFTNPTPPAGAKTPAQIAQAYGFSNIFFNGIKGDGTGMTIAIVDAYDAPTAQADLNVFSAQYGLPMTTIARVNQYGTTSYPTTDTTGGWEEEVALDVEWAHAIAPGAKILLVEANSANDTDLLTAVDYAAAHANVVSMSWGGSEFAGEANYDSHFKHAGVAFVASSGDSGAPISWPAASPNVLAVGGTSLYLGSGSAWASETGWSGSGGGPSAYYARPTYQNSVVTQTTKRANPDVAYDGSPSTGFAVYDSFVAGGNSPGWVQVGGTSAGAPQWAALLAIADQGRALSGQPLLDAASPTEVMTTLYANASTGIFHDVTTGTSTGRPNYASGVGYDYVTGLGSPKADLVVQALVGVPATPLDHLVVSAPSTGTAGTSFTVTVTAQTSTGATDANYVGTVHFTSTDAKAGLPTDYTFVAADHGVHTFTVTLKTAATQTVTATDAATAAIKGTASGIVIKAAAASQIVLTGPSGATAGSSQSFIVTALDPYGNVATGYTGTVHFTSTDGAATLPADYTFVAADGGVHSFGVTFGTAGVQTLTVAGGAGLTATSSSTVSPAAPINLSASTALTSAITLVWSSSTGATGYSIERSANGTTGWTQVGTTTGATTLQDSGLAAGTTYYYRVRATGASVASGYSNVASATTNGTAAATPTSIWGDSYTPSIDAYTAGNYELGLKFKVDVAGAITGVRFYKQTWMGGYVHVGHVWSSTGALLGTVRFTNETASGWEQATFTTPISVTANTTYIVSFSTGGGYAGISTTSLRTSGVDNGPLHALSNTAAGGNGVYGVGGSFPRTSAGGMNFWADVAFSPTSGAHVMRQATASSTTGATSSLAAPAVTVAIPTVSNSTASTTSNSSTGASTPRTAPRQDVSPSWPYRGVVPQTMAFSRSKWFFN